MTLDGIDIIINLYSDVGIMLKGNRESDARFDMAALWDDRMKLLPIEESPFDPFCSLARTIEFLRDALEQFHVTIMLPSSEAPTIV